MERFGPYELINKLAAGGMGEIFRARLVGPEEFEKQVAVKRIFSHLGEDEHYRKLFVREAKLASRLNHRNIVQVFDLGEVSGQLYIAMEFVDGTDLASVLRYRLLQRLPLDCATAALAARDIAAGLTFAHTLESDGHATPVVHRDISPQNILVSMNGVAKICDFGVARGALPETSSSDLLKGRRVGKLSYMAPEQALGSEVDARADIYSLGVIMFVATTGKQPHETADGMQLLQHVLEGPRVHIQDADPDIPDDFARIVDKAIARDLEERYQSADELHADLDAYLTTQDVDTAREELRIVVQDLRYTVIQQVDPNNQFLSGNDYVEKSDVILPDCLFRDEEERNYFESTTSRANREEIERRVRELDEKDRQPTVAGRGQNVAPQDSEFLVQTVPAAPARPRQSSARKRRRSEPAGRRGSHKVRVEVRHNRPDPWRQSVGLWIVLVIGVGALVGVVWFLQSRLHRPAVATTVSEVSIDAVEQPPRVGYLSLQANPWAKIIIDGVPLAQTTPLIKRPVPIGERRVILQGPNGEERVLLVDIPPGQVVTEIVNFE